MTASPALMAIVNVNDDSFSDPRDGIDADERRRAVLDAVAAGATYVDLGAQSAATHLPVVPDDVQVARLVPLIRDVRAHTDVVISVDTYRPVVADACLAAGADLVNDYSGLHEPDMLDVLVDHPRSRYVLTHNEGAPKVRVTESDRYADTLAHVTTWLRARVERLVAAGIAAERVVLDPGIDLSKTPAQTVDVLRGAADLHAALPDHDLLYAISRKDVIGTITGLRPAARDPGTLAVVETLRDVPRMILRVHDVAGTASYLAVRDVLAGRQSLDASARLSRDVFIEPGAPPRP